MPKKREKIHTSAVKRSSQTITALFKKEKEKKLARKRDGDVEIVHVGTACRSKYFSQRDHERPNLVAESKGSRLRLRKSLNNIFTEAPFVNSCKSETSCKRQKTENWLSDDDVGSGDKVEEQISLSQKENCKQIGAVTRSQSCERNLGSASVATERNLVKEGLCLFKEEFKNGLSSANMERDSSRLVSTDVESGASQFGNHKFGQKEEVDALVVKPDLTKTKMMQQLQGDSPDVAQLTSEESDESDVTCFNEEQIMDKIKDEPRFHVPYYLENFKEILFRVFEDEDNRQLFNSTDMDYIDKFNNLSEAGQKLFVRLFSRKLTWHAESRMKYPEIATDVSNILQELVNVGFGVREDHLVDLKQTLQLLSATDLKAVAKSFHLTTTGVSKNLIVDSLLKHSRQTSVASFFGSHGNGMTNRMLARAKSLFKGFKLMEESHAVFARVLTLFSLVNISFDEDSPRKAQNELFQMLLVNMGKLVYPRYTIKKITRILHEREDLIRLETAIQFEADITSKMEKKNWTGAFHVYLEAKAAYAELKKNKNICRWDSSLPQHLRYCTAGDVYTRILYQGVELLQRRKDYTAAVAQLRDLLDQTVYGCDHRGRWWERLALNLDLYLKQTLLALRAVEDGLNDPYVKTGHRLALYQRAKRICGARSSRWSSKLKKFHHEQVREAPKTYVEGRVCSHSIPGVRYQFMVDGAYTADAGTQDVTLCGVEHLVLDYYRNSGYPEGLHAEGSVVTSLFCLYFWDEMFMDIADAFHSPYQNHPLDLYSDHFYLSRQAAVDARLNQIRCSSVQDLHKMLIESWEANFGTTASGMNWELFRNVEHIQGLVSCMGGVVLAGIISRFAKDPHHVRSGFPDLTLWNTETGKLKISEVKGPGDRLSHKQMLWLDYLLKLGVDAEVCHVKAVTGRRLISSPPMD